MKIKDGFMLREIVGTWLVVPIGERVVDFNGMITLSDTGAFLWNIMSEKDCSEEELISALLSEYEVDRVITEVDVRDFLETLEAMRIIEGAAERAKVD